MDDATNGKAFRIFGRTKEQKQITSYSFCYQTIHTQIVNTLPYCMSSNIFFDPVVLKETNFNLQLFYSIVK